MWGLVIYGAVALLFGGRSYLRVNDPVIRAIIDRDCPADRRIPPLIAATLAGLGWPWFMLTRGRRH